MDKTTKSLVTGATGLIGPRLVKALGGEVVVAARDPKKAESMLGVKAYAWDGKADIPVEAFEGVDTVFHLAGEPVANGRWTDEKKQRIMESRELGTRAVVRSMRAAGTAMTLISTSGVGYYGTRGDEELDEKSSPGEGFLTDVCTAWEREALAYTGGRVAILRTGVVLSPDGGALGPMLPVFKLGLGGRVGDGTQWLPWIHMDDEVALFLHARDNDIHGPICACAPLPVTNADFAKALGHALHRPAVLPAPSFALNIALGEMAHVITDSQRVYPKVAEATGYKFLFRDIDSALANLFPS